MRPIIDNHMLINYNYNKMKIKTMTIRKRDYRSRYTIKYLAIDVALLNLS